MHRVLRATVQYRILTEYATVELTRAGRKEANDPVKLTRVTESNFSLRMNTTS